MIVFTVGRLGLGARPACVNIHHVPCQPHGEGIVVQHDNKLAELKFSKLSSPGLPKCGFHVMGLIKNNHSIGQLDAERLTNARVQDAGSGLVGARRNETANLTKSFALTSCTG